MSELTIVEQLALIAQDAEAEYQAMLMWACLSGLAAGALAGGFTLLVTLLKVIGIM